MRAGKHLLVGGPRERLDILDGLRGCAIVLVVWYHAGLVSGQTTGPFDVVVKAGYLGVDLFFFISGFCLYYPYARARSAGIPPPSTGYFFERRALKIVPSYLLALAVFSIVYRASFASPQDALFQLLAHVTFLHPLLPATFGAISGPLWTIGVEVEFYLLFPLIVRTFAGAPLTTYVALVLAAEAYRTGIAALGLSTSFWCMNQLPAVVDLFAAGMLGAQAFIALRARGGAAERRATLIALTALGGVLAACAGVSAFGDAHTVDATHDWVNAHRILVGPLIFVFATATFFAAAPFRALVANRALVFLSAISYNLYLWHLEIVVWVHNSGLAPLPVFVLSIALAIGVAAALTYALERPLLRADLRAAWRALRRPAARAQAQPALTTTPATR